MNLYKNHSYNLLVELHNRSHLNFAFKTDIVFNQATVLNVFSVCSWLALTTTNALDECGVYNDCPKINCAKHIYCSKKRELVCGISHRGQEKTFRNCCKLRKVNCILKTGWRKMYDGQCGKCA
ncbi:uncharacterized protein LOC142331049 isoform X3 [Lycorma delicatula]|uniref:uncharacterized protein LOC142331049 isoform X3 n=1 Tax=Lycorma delicatula TaxID=130591 RepID=UPI003F51833F